MTDAAREDRPTEVLATEVLVPAQREEPRRRSGRGWLIALVVVVVIGALLVVADVVVRNIAEQRVAAQLEQNLPEGVEGDVDVSINGFSVIAQYLAGSMDHVELTAPALSVAGVPIDVAVDLRDVPPALDGPVGRIQATAEADGAAISDLIALAGVEGGVTLEDGAVAYERSAEVFGINVRAVIRATPVAAGDTVVLESLGAELAAGAGSIDFLTDAITEALEGEELSICIAEYLPDGAQVTDIAITEQAARVTLDGEDMSLDEASLATTGSCG